MAFFVLFKSLQQDCLTDAKLVDMNYYHRAIKLNKNNKPLHGANIVVSGYTSSEAQYLCHLAMALGGVVNEQYSKTDYPILICSTPDGENYEKAIEWSKCHSSMLMQ